jgi:hypothetical protein
MFWNRPYKDEGSYSSGLLLEHLISPPADVEPVTQNMLIP